MVFLMTFLLEGTLWLIDPFEMCRPVLMRKVRSRVSWKFSLKAQQDVLCL